MGKKLKIIILFASLLLMGGKIIFAQTLVYPTMNSDGSMDKWEDQYTQNQAGLHYQIYKGYFPDTTNPVSTNQNPGCTNCNGSLYFNSFTVFDSGWNAGDGAYWINASSSIASPAYDIYTSWSTLGSNAFGINPAVSEATSTGFFRFFNVPQLLREKLPFAIFYQVTDILSTTTATATTTPLGTFSIKLGNSTTTVDMFSTSTVTHFIPPTSLALLRGLLAAITYAGSGMFLFTQIRHLI